MRQIHAAIEHWRRGDFECAITLAGAADQISVNGYGNSIVILTGLSSSIAPSLSLVTFVTLCMARARGPD
jgi:hypothetical protein